MTDLDLADRRDYTDCICQEPISSIADTNQFYVNTTTLHLYPGYNPSSLYTNNSSAPYPMDRFATGVMIQEGCAIRAYTSTSRFIEKRESVKRGWVRTSTQIERIEVERIICQLQIIANNTNVYSAPSMIPSNLQNFIDSKQSIIIEKDLVILPVYSETEILLTPDLFGIKIKKGSEIILQSGGAIGNINIIVKKGAITMNCNPDLNIPDCLCPIDEKYSLDSIHLLEG